MVTIKKVYQSGTRSVYIEFDDGTGMSVSCGKRNDGSYHIDGSVFKTDTMDFICDTTDPRISTPNKG